MKNEYGSKRKYLPGVSVRVGKDGKIKDYRASLTVKGRHISLGSYSTEKKAHEAYLSGKRILREKTVQIRTLPDKPPLAFEKCVSLINLRDNGLYIPTPIYLKKNYFLYYFSPSVVYRFDIEDLFYYSAHKIMKRGSHLFVSDYGSQINIMSRFGISAHAVKGRDFDFYNKDPYDLRYENIRIINRYNGVRRIFKGTDARYKAVINLHSNYIVGVYDTEEEAAIAYNKAADILTQKGLKRRFRLNYIQGLSPSEYVEIYGRTAVSRKITDMDISGLKL